MKYDAMSGLLASQKEVDDRKKKMRVKCPWCRAKSMKRYSWGRGFRMHLEAMHKERLGETALEDVFAMAIVDGARPEKEELPACCIAARDGNSVELEVLFVRREWEPLGLTGRDRHGYRAHHWAAGSSLGCLRTCLKYASQSEIDALTFKERKDGSRGGRSLLHWAARNGCLENAKLLISIGANIEARTHDGTTPLMLALYGGHLNVCDLLRESGALIGIQKNCFHCNDVHWSAMGEGFAFDWLAQYGPPEAFLAIQVHGHSFFHKLAQHHASLSDLSFFTRTQNCTVIPESQLPLLLKPDISGRRPSDIALCAGFDPSPFCQLEEQYGLHHATASSDDHDITTKVENTRQGKTAR